MSHEDQDCLTPMQFPPQLSLLLIYHWNVLHSTKSTLDGRLLFETSESRLEMTRRCSFRNLFLRNPTFEAEDLENFLKLCHPLSSVFLEIHEEESGGKFNVGLKCLEENILLSV